MGIKKKLRESQAAWSWRSKAGNRPTAVAFGNIEPSTGPSEGAEDRLLVTCRAAAFANITLENYQTIDDVALAENDKVLVFGQTDPIENGIWRVHSGAWTRYEKSITSSMIIGIREGSAYSDNLFLCITDNIDVGVNPLQFRIIIPKSNLDDLPLIHGADGNNRYDQLSIFKILEFPYIDFSFQNGKILEVNEATNQLLLVDKPTSGVTVHNDLTGRDLPAQHPDTSIEVQGFTGAFGSATDQNDVNTITESHIDDTTIHFEQQDIDHSNLIGAGLNTHMDIDAHLADDLAHVPSGAGVGLYLTFENGKLVWKSVTGSTVDVNTETLSADKFLSINSPQFHYLGASGQKVVLPALNTDDHKEFTFFCTNGNFQIQNINNTIIDTVYVGNYKSYIWTGIEWEGTSVGSSTGVNSFNLIIGKNAKATNGVAIGDSADCFDGIAVGNEAKSIQNSEAFGSGQAIHLNSIAHDGATTTNETEEARNIHQGNGGTNAMLSELMWFTGQQHGLDEVPLLLGGNKECADIPYGLGVMAYRVTVIGRRNDEISFARFEFDLTISRFNAAKIIIPDNSTNIFPIHEYGATNAYVRMWEKSASDFGILVCANEDGLWTWTARMTGLHHEVQG